MNIFALLAITFSMALAQTSCVVRVLSQPGSSFRVEESQLQVFTFPVGGHPVDNSDAKSLLQSFKCNPDGNCFFVVQDVNDFVMRINGPVGAYFEPNSIRVQLGPAPLDCEGFLFNFKGFKLEIPVSVATEEGEKSAIAGFKINLRSADQSTTSLTKFTDEKGIATFSELQPTLGTTYLIDLQVPTVTDQSGNEHQAFTLKGSQTIDCTLTELSGFECSDRFVITGSLVYGTVRGEALLDLIQTTGDVLMSTKTDPQGAFFFKGVPQGQYTVRATSLIVQKQQTNSSNSPIRVQAGVKLNLPEIEIYSNRIEGQVVGMQGAPSPQVDISINGQPIGQTDQDGKYFFEFQKSETILVEAKSERNIYDAMQIKVDSQTKTLPTMKAIAVQACGYVGLLKEDRSADSWIIKGYKPSVGRRVFSKQLPNPLEGETWETDGIMETLVPQREIRVDANGKYCFVVKQGLWLIWPEVSEEERSQGFVFQQEELRAFITDTGILSLSFLSSYLKVEGKVECLNPDDCMGLTIKLTQTGISEIPDKVRRETKTDENGNFVFDKVRKLSYGVEVVNEGFCWAKQLQRVKVDKDTLKDLVFEQKGFEAVLESGIKFDATVYNLMSPNDKQQVVLESGKQTKLCLSSRADWVIEPRSDCYRFDKKQFSISFDSKPLRIDPTSVRISGKVLFDEQLTSAQMKAAYITVDAGESVNIEFSTNQAAFNLFAPIGKPITITPNAQIEDSYLLFTPSSLTIPAGTTCVSDLILVAQPGILIQGIITPPLTNVLIVIESEGGRYETLSSSQGVYSYGPVPMADYRVSATKDDFILKRQSGFDFLAQRIAKLEISIVDSSGKPLPNVHVSLTAYDTRLAQVTDSDGIAKFSNLNPQTYYVTAILKEYQFEDSISSIEIKEGEHAQEVLVGKRFAFSAYGLATTITGRPLSSGTIIATQINGRSSRQEQALIDSDGSFRVMNLTPGSSYRLELESPKVARQVPSDLIVTIPAIDEDADVYDVRVFAFERPTKITIEGRVRFEDLQLFQDANSDFRVELFATADLAQSSAQPLKSQKLAPSSYFLFNNLNPALDYSLVVKSKGQITVNHSWPVNEGFNSVTVPKPQARKEPQQISMLLMPLAFFASFLWLARRKQ